jgi:hypothetical protein
MVPRRQWSYGSSISSADIALALGTDGGISHTSLTLGAPSASPLAQLVFTWRHDYA